MLNTVEKSAADRKTTGNLSQCLKLCNQL